MRSRARAYFVLAMLLPAASASAKVKTGTYTGDGFPSRSITGVGFAPVAVIVKGNDTDASDDLTSAVLSSATMPAGMAKPLKGDQALGGSMILSLDGDGLGIGIISSSAAVHYGTKRATSRRGRAPTGAGTPSWRSTSHRIRPDGTAAAGVPTVDLLNSMVYVGTDQGVIYGVLLPLP